MKIRITLLGAIAFSAVLFSQELRHDVTVVNISVPVRVYKGDQFVDDLKIDDFEVYEDGKPQTVAAVYLIKQTKIEREEGPKKFTPPVERQFVFLFQMTEYVPEIRNAMDYFFKNVFLAEDTLEVHTPRKTYKLKGIALAALGPEKVRDQLLEKLRRDIVMGGSECLQIIRELKSVLNAEDPMYAGHDTDELYQALLDRLEQMRFVDQKRLLNFATYLKKREGQKHVFLFYQKEMIPKLVTKELMDLGSNYRMMSLMHFFKRDINFDVETVRKAFSDSSIAAHFLFITKAPAQDSRIEITEMKPAQRVTMTEQSEDVYSAFREIAHATGGIVDSTSNIESALRKATEASENYYLLYYQPIDYKADKKFKNITIKVKGNHYRISHRLGYFAR
jgi:VWFA-related protein